MAIRYRDTTEQLPARSLAEVEREARAAYGRAIEALNRTTDRDMQKAVRARIRPIPHTPA